MRDCDVGEVRIDDLYNLVVVISQLLKLEIKVIQTGNKLHFRRVAFDDNELLGEDSFDDKTAAVMLQSGLTKQLVEADILLFIEAERILVTRSFGLLCSFLVSIHSFGLERRSTRENAPASQSEHLCRTNANLSDKGTARYPLARVRIRAGESLPEVFRIPRYSFRGWGCSRCNITTVGRRKKARRTDWSGQWRTSGRKRFTLLYIAAGIKESVCEP